MCLSKFLKKNISKFDNSLALYMIIKDLATKKENMAKQRPLIIQYLNLLHRHCGYSLKPIQDFLREHQSNADLQRRARALNRVFDLKTKLTS